MHTDTVANELPETPFTELPADPVPADASLTPVEGTPGTLVHHVTYLLTEAGVDNPEEWVGVLEQIHPGILESTNLDVQRFHINRTWTAIFGCVPADKILETRNARGCLQGSQCSVEDWSRLFKENVIPCALAQNLLTLKA